MQSDLELPLISQRLHTPSGQQDAESQRNHSARAHAYTHTHRHMRKSETHTEKEGCVCAGFDSQGHLNKHKPDAEHEEHVCGQGTGVCG